MKGISNIGDLGILNYRWMDGVPTPHSLPVPSSLLPLMGGGDTVSLQVIQPGKDLDATPGKN